MTEQTKELDKFLEAIPEEDYEIALNEVIGTMSISIAQMEFDETIQQHIETLKKDGMSEEEMADSIAEIARSSEEITDDIDELLSSEDGFEDFATEIGSLYSEILDHPKSIMEALDKQKFEVAEYYTQMIFKAKDIFFEQFKNNPDD
ncbi:hypothetical protein Zmor_012162 [Zophobas morio]|uniref:Uncharacterized protein n=1 Tax=Zophobas morio TaxID=2755281 RepID=A0AA38HID9_9CUCU|nr:hypothetical protein Zmor_012162 [Zophobas morio]